jgi:3'-5' exonuclease
MDTLTLDIETIPQQTKLSEIAEEELQKKINRQKESDESPEELKNRVMATSPYFGEIICIGLMKTNDKGQFEKLGLIGEEKEILIKFWNIVKNHYYGLYVSYNGLGFDVPFIVKRSMMHKILPTSKDFTDTRRFQKHPHFDVMNHISDYDRYAAPTLRLACDFLGIPSPKEGDIAAKDVYTAFKAGRIEAIKDYCLRDVEATYKAYDIVRRYTK